MFETLVECIKQFPKLDIQYQTLLSDGFNITNIIVRSTPRDNISYSGIEIIMENNQGITKVITFYNGSVKIISSETIHNSDQKIDENMILTSKLILNKEFDKSFFGGYKTDQINTFLDIIVNDYKYIENVLLPEYKELKSLYRQ